MSYVLDTNFLVSLLNEDDPGHRSAVKKWLTVGNSTAITIPQVVASEVLVGAQDVSATLTQLNEIGQIRQNNLKDLAEMEDIPPLTRKSLRANDCMILIMSRRLDAELVTLDNRLLKTYSKLLSNSAR